jgi:thiol:disulfide interchange protein DsbD
MIPILSGMLARSGEQLTARRGFVLSATYVVSMSLAYASLGLVVAWSGQNLQVALQTPIALGLMSAIFLALALSMFGLYDLQLPQSWQSRLIGAGAARRGGSLGGAAMMGFASALIVGPCVTPPLAAALVYVAQTGNLVRGAMALFALGIGMGLPLLAFGTFGAGILPKSGPWLTGVKQAFGLVFVGMAIWMISRVLPTWAAVELWGAGFAGAGIFLVSSTVFARQNRRSWSALPVAAGLACLAVGALLIGRSSSGFPRILDQFTASTFASIAEASAAEFKTVRTPSALDDAIAIARRSGRAVVLDFSAEWCVECKVMDRTVFSDGDVRRHLKDFALIRADATDYNEDTRTLMKAFGVVGPPTIIFLDAQDGKEARDTRIVGPVDATTFLKRLDRFRPT